ncbi:MAG: Hpt domain-containing protein, partial [Candidatus Heimdallarchaeota archaeon]|nr:Hpt domain-containing protein [Candidatus Heimdallarchaeota archaeon]
LETSITQWKKNKDSFIKTVAEGIDNEETKTFIEMLEKNLNLLNLENYFSFLNLLKEVTAKSTENPLGNEVAKEFDSAFDLFFDRIRLHGKNGDCNDIIAALTDTISETTPGEDKKEKAKPVDELKEEIQDQTSEAEAPKEAEDDLSLFRDETKEYLKTIDSNLKEFHTSKERKHLAEIETALHSVRSAAHYLNLQDISKLAATIEEAAELFGQSDLPMPDNLDTDLRIGVQTLENLILSPETEFSATLEMMESLIDHIVIEDMGSSESEKIDLDSTGVEEESSENKVEEKPLFAEGQEEDAELLEIFKEESGTFIANIQGQNKKLLEDPSNSAVAKEMGYSAHSLKSAAKMLGFREISQITDGLEIVTEAISNSEIQHTKALHDAIEKAVVILKDLSEGNTVSSTDISNIVNNLELENWKESSSDSDEQDEDQLP